LASSKGKPALLSHSLHVLMENRSGLCLDVAVASSECEDHFIEKSLRISDNVFDSAMHSR